MEHSMYITFRIKKSKANKNGLCPINLRLILDSNRTELSTHRFINPESWDAKLGRAIGTSDEAIILNNYLDNLKVKVQKQFNILESLGKPITLLILKEKLGGKTEKKYTLIDVFEYHNSDIKKRINLDVALGTYNRYKVSLKRIKEFINYQYGTNDIWLEELNHAFLTKYEMYLKTVKHCAQNTATKYLVRLKKVVNLSLANKWIIRDPIIKYQCTYKPTYRGYLNADELQIIELKEFKIPRLQKVRDIFVFCCYTGFAQADAEPLTPSDLSIGIDGEKIDHHQPQENRWPQPYSFASPSPNHCQQIQKRPRIKIYIDRDNNPKIKLLNEEGNPTSAEYTVYNYK